MGLLWAAKALQGGSSCSLLMRPTAKPRLNLDTFAKQSSQSIDFSYRTLNQSQSISFSAESVPINHLLENSVDNLIVATKAYQMEAAILDVLPALNNNANIIGLCNGLGIQQRVQNILKNQENDFNIFWALSNDGAIKNGEKNNGFSVTQTGFGVTAIGNLDKNTGVNSAIRLKHLLGWPLELQICDPITPQLWKKFFINCAINPLTAFYGCKNGELYSIANYRLHFDSLIEELEVVAKKLDWNRLNQEENRSPSGYDFDIKDSIYNVAQQTAENHSSMWKDFKHNRPNELNFLNGYLSKLGARLNCDLAINQSLVQQLQSKGFGAANRSDSTNI